jgi:SAM-dependent methyltransferase
VTIPTPPGDLMRRVGMLGPGSDAATAYRVAGSAILKSLEAALPAGRSLEAASVLDFGSGAGRVTRALVEDGRASRIAACDPHRPSIEWMQAALPTVDAFVCAETPIPRPDASYDLVLAVSVFTHIADSWADWLAELHRLLRPEGLLLATILGEGMLEQLFEEPWDEEAIGMNVLRREQSWDLGGPFVFHSDWWLREHWGRAFEIVSSSRAGFATEAQTSGHGLLVLQRRPGEVTAETLRAVDHSDAREWRSLEHNIDQLQRDLGGFQRNAEGLEQRVAALEQAQTKPREP